MPPVSVEGKPFKSIATVDEIVDVLENVALNLKPTDYDNKYVVFAVRDLIWVSLSIISSTVRNLHWRYNAYTAASMTRLLMECVTEIKYIQSHPKKAKSFWQSQQKIEKTFENLSNDEKWKLFGDGTLSRYGQLSDSTTSRVRSVLDEDDIGRYNLLCFYSHPNIAGYAWVSRDTAQPGTVVRFVAETFFKMIDEMLHATSAIESQSIDLSRPILYAQKGYLQYIAECDGEKT